MKKLSISFLINSLKCKTNFWKINQVFGHMCVKPTILPTVYIPFAWHDIHQWKENTYTLFTCPRQRWIVCHGRVTKSPPSPCDVVVVNKGHFTHKTEGSRPLHSKISHWSKRMRPSKFTSQEKVNPKVPRKIVTDENLHGRLWIRFHGLLEFASCSITSKR